MLAGLIKQAAADATQRRTLALAGQRMVLERFTLDRMIGDIERYLRAIVETSTKPFQAAPGTWPGSSARCNPAPMDGRETVKSSP
jgi:hypothetical protein